MKSYWQREMEGLKLTERGEMVFNVLGALGSAAVLIGCLVSMWAFAALAITK